MMSLTLHVECFPERREEARATPEGKRSGRRDSRQADGYGAVSDPIELDRCSKLLIVKHHLVDPRFTPVG
jgi:hypothetical protein